MIYAPLVQSFAIPLNFLWSFYKSDCYSLHVPKVTTIILFKRTLSTFAQVYNRSEISRSLKDYSQENVSALVDRIIEGKVDDCQLSSADISLRELNILKDVIKSYLMQMHHSRVAYPKRKVKK